MNLFRKNLVQKVISLVIAIGCWFYVMNDQNPQIENSYTLPVTVLNLPSGYSVSKDLEEAKITIKAPRALFSNLDTKNIKIFVDLNHIDTGVHEVQLQTVLPSGFELVSVEPGKITVSVERIEEKSVPVKINITGKPGAGKIVANTMLSLQNVKVQGPTSVINKVTGVLGVINVAGMNEDNTFNVSLMPVDDHDKQIPGVRLLTKEIAVQVALAKGLNTKIVDVKPAVMSNLPEEYLLKSITVDPDRIEISGQDDLISNISYIPTQQISLENITKPTTMKVRLAVPKNINTPDVDITVNVDVEKRDMDIKKSSD